MSTNATPNPQTEVQGIWLAISTYSIWGLFPLYFNLLKSVPALETLIHRIFWTSIFTCFVVFTGKRRALIWSILCTPKLLMPLLLSALFLAINWGLFIYGITLSDVLQMSLAYFINPLFNALFGVVFFKERLGALTKVAITLAVLGVLVRAFSSSGMPILAITIAMAFSTYGALRKKTKVEPISALLVESTLMLPVIAILFFAFTDQTSLDLMGTSGYWVLLFLLSGPITSIPLITFSMALSRIPYYLVGLIQYITPTLMFLTAVLVFDEHWSGADLVTFGLVWAGIVLVLYEQIVRIQKLVKMKIQ